MSPAVAGYRQILIWVFFGGTRQPLELMELRRVTRHCGNSHLEMLFGPLAVNLYGGGNIKDAQIYSKTDINFVCVIATQPGHGVQVMLRL